jgi:AcrR family transcriptional regulator
MSGENRAPHPLSQRRVASTRDKIIAAAAAILTEEGITGISTRRIATRAKVNQALVHYHFGSIENLMLEVLRGSSAQAMSIVRSRYEGSADFVEQWLADLGSIFEGEGVLGPKAWLEIMGVVINDDDLLQTYKKEFADPNYAIMKDAVVRSLSHNGEASDTDAEAIASLALLIKAGLFLNSLIARSGSEEKALELAARLLSQHAQSIRKQQGATRRTARLAGSG